MQQWSHAESVARNGWAGLMFEDVNQVSNGCSLNCASSPRVKARGLIEPRQNFSTVEAFCLAGISTYKMWVFESTQCRIIRLFSKNVHFVKSLEVEQKSSSATTAFSRGPCVGACVCVCMYKNIRSISQKAKRTSKDNTSPFQKFYTLKLNI